MDLFDLGDGCPSYHEGVARVKCPTLIIGVQSDMLFPVWQQRELAKILEDGLCFASGSLLITCAAGTPTTYYELNAMYGHDTFLIDVDSISRAVKGHLSMTEHDTEGFDADTNFAN